jgi:hypothetical protein
MCDVLLDYCYVNCQGPDLSVLFQNQSLLVWLSVYENVRLGVDKVFASSKSRSERDAWTMHNLNLVQMAHAKDKRTAEISGDMKQSSSCIQYPAERLWGSARSIVSSQPMKENAESQRVFERYRRDLQGQILPRSFSAL